MSLRQIDESFPRSQSEETACLYPSCTDDTKEFVPAEETNSFYKEEVLAGHDEKTLEIKESLGDLEDAVVFESDITGSNESVKGHETSQPHRSIRQRDEILASIREESGEENGTERRATLVEPEESENEEDPQVGESEQQRLLLYENFDKEACEKCFKILEENAEQLTKLSCSEKAGFLEDSSSATFEERADRKEKSCKISHDIDLDSSGSFRASLHSLATCQDSLPSSRRCPSRKDLCLDLDLECRICHDAEGHDLISPCHCAGTSKWVHESCIIKWIRHTKTKQCEICTCPITVKRKKKPIDQWTRPSATCGPCNKLDIWYCFVLALCVLIIIGFVVLQSRYDVTDQIETTLIFASIYVLCGMIIMMKARYFWTWFVHRSSFWGNWKNLNEEWKIIEANEANAQTPVSPV